MQKGFNLGRNIAGTGGIQAHGHTKLCSEVRKSDGILILAKK